MLLKVRLTKSGSRDLVKTLNRNLLNEFLKDGYEVAESSVVKLK